MRKLLALLSLTSLLAAPALAQDRVDLDDDGASSSRTGAKSRATTKVVREIVRGYYLKANVGSTVYLGQRGTRGLLGRTLIRPGTTLNLTVGGDFLNKDRVSAAWEISFYQAIHNGLSYQDQAGAGLTANQYTQGDVHVLGATAGFEASAYPTRRLGIGGHLGGGVAFVPLLMDQFYYDQEVVGTGPGDGAFGGPEFNPKVHQGAKPMIYVGPTIEYYTKLSHFSFGADIDFIYVIGLDYGLAITGYFKYTF